jgi:hypothetical protein
MVGMSRSGRLATAAAGLVVAGVAAPLARSLTSTPLGRTWSRVVDDAMSDLSGVWRVLRGVYAYALIPTLFVLLAVLLYVTHRQRGARAAWVLVAVAVLSNVMVQVVKLAPLGIEQGPTALDPLSGHVGVAAGVCLGWLVVAPTRWRVGSAVAAAAVLVAVTSGVILAGWHSPFQVLCPLLIATGWTTVAAAVLSPTVPRPGGRQRSERSSDARHGWAALLSGLLVVAGTSAVLFRFQESIVLMETAAVVLAALWTAGWCAAVVGFVLIASRQVPDPRSGPAWEGAGPLLESGYRSS